MGLAQKINTEEITCYPKKPKRPLRAIRYFCFECMGWDRRYKDSGKPIEDVKNCTDEMCSLYDFRFGKNPFLKPKITQKTLDALEKGRKRLEVVKGKSDENQRKDIRE